MTAAAMLLLLSLAVGILALTVGRAAAAHRRPAKKDPAYEHGARTGHQKWLLYRIRYAPLALIFIAFDLEMVYMFRWAVVFRRLGTVAFLDMFVFVAILFAWKEGALDWEG